ncbi:MAG: LysR substrate-binding domain-containing protein [Parvibaculaceae bacterium]
MSRFPSLSALRTFEAVLRTGGFTRAAQELGVTQAAVSRQVARLEQDLGLRLLERLPKGIEPTEAGSRLSASLSRAFGDIARALEDIGASGDRQILTVSVAPYFSARWLTPRLPRFMGRHPEIDVRLHHSYLPPDHRRDRIDLGLNWGTGAWPGATSEMVLKGDLSPVMSRRLFERMQPRTPRDLARQPLLQEFGTEDWQKWFAAAGAAPPKTLKSRRIDDFHALRRAVLDEQGTGLFFVGLMEEDLASGQLVQPFPVTVDVGTHYWLNYPRDRALPRKAKLFRSWIRQEMAREPYC